MLCLEVTINGEQRVSAGVAMAQSLNASVTAHPGFNQAWIKWELNAIDCEDAIDEG